MFAAILAGNALVSIAIGLAGDRIGRCRAYVLAVMSAAGVAYALSDSVVVLVLALTGTLSTDANESGPLTSLEQAMLGGALGFGRASSAGTTRSPTCPEPSARSPAARR